MNIGFDFDKVFVDYPPFVPSKIIDSFYKRKSKSLSYRIPKKAEQIVRDLTHISFLRPLIKENYEALKKMSTKRKHKHYLISSRFSFLRKRTENLIQKHNLKHYFDEMYFNFKDEQPHEFKHKTIKKLKIKKYIDDDLDLLTYLSKLNKQTTFYWLNKNINKKISKNLIATTSFQDVFE